MVNNLSEALLAFLLTLYRTGSMKSTALRLGISASTASYNLKAARAIFCDELFLRTGNGMVPTTHMVGIAPKIESALLVLKDLTASELAPFSPAEATDVFRLGCVDNVYPALLAPVLPKLLEVLRFARRRPFHQTSMRAFFIEATIRFSRLPITRLWRLRAAKACFLTKIFALIGRFRRAFSF